MCGCKRKSRLQTPPELDLSTHLGLGWAASVSLINRPSPLCSLLHVYFTFRGSRSSFLTHTTLYTHYPSLALSCFLRYPSCLPELLSLALAVSPRWRWIWMRNALADYETVSGLSAAHTIYLAGGNVVLLDKNSKKLP